MSSMFALSKLAMLFVSTLLMDGSPRYFRATPTEGTASLVVTLSAQELYDAKKANTFIWSFGNVNYKPLHIITILINLTTYRTPYEGHSLSRNRPHWVDIGFCYVQYNTIQYKEIAFRIWTTLKLYNAKDNIHFISDAKLLGQRF